MKIIMQDYDEQNVLETIEAKMR